MDTGNSAQNTVTVSICAHFLLLNICNQESLFQIRNDIPVTVAATIMINPCTAYRYFHH